MKDPLVSIIVPCYNQGEFLDEALRSVYSQKYAEWECIIINDGSTDNTSQVVKKWLGKDDRFKYIVQKNLGVSKARNNAISNSAGKYILPLDADDLISENYILLGVRTFEESQDIKLIYCQAEKFGLVSEDWHLPPFSLYNLAQKNIIFTSSIYKKKDWEKIGGYDEKMIVGLEDWEFWISLLKNGGNVICLREVGFYYRIKALSRNKNLNTKNTTELYNYLSIKHTEFFINQLGSFIHLNNKINLIKEENLLRLRSEKFVINLFFKTFFGFTIFKKNK